MNVSNDCVKLAVFTWFPLHFLLAEMTCPQYNQSFNNSWIIEVFAPEEGAVEGHYIEGTIVAVSCTQGYSGGGNSTCQINGRWTAVTCSCEELFMSMST